MFLHKLRHPVRAAAATAVAVAVGKDIRTRVNEAAAATVAEGAGDGRLEGGAAVAVAALSYHGLSLASSALPPRRSHVRLVPNVLHPPRRLH